MSQKLVIVAGEASGDAHAARMITELTKLRPDVEISGIGGDALRQAGVDIIADFAELAVMGLVEVLKRYHRIKKIYQQLIQHLKETQPDMLILVDYPGFNLRLARDAKRLGIKVFYYIGPKIWASRAGRINKIKRYVDFMAVLFPFEVEIYQKAGVPVRCVGHPLVDAVQCALSPQQAKAVLGIDPQHRVVGLFPGSRRSEVDALLPLMLAAAEGIHARHFDVTIVLPLAPGLSLDYLKSKLADTKLPIKIVEGNFYQLVRSCDVIVAASGTVTLEIALLGVPHFLIYRVAPLTYKLLKRMVLIPYVGLCNIVTNKNLIVEVLQDEVTVERIDTELTQRLTDAQSMAKAEAIRQQVLEALGPSGGARNAADAVLEELAKL